MKKIIVSVTNDLTTDQRVHRTCNTLVKSGYEVLLVGRKLKNSLAINRIYSTKRMALLFNKGFLFYAEYNIRLFFFLMFEPKDILLSNDVDTIIPNFLTSKLFNKPLLFDSHELFSEVPELIDRPIVKAIWKKAEHYFIPKIKNKYTVSNSIANYYKTHLNTTFEVIRNVPQKLYTDIQKSDLTLHKNAIIYQGAINKGRGLELIIETMQYLPNSTLYIIGDGDITEQLKQLVIKLNLSKKVIFLGKIIPENLQVLTIQAVLGISLEEELGLNYQYALPNKLFDYIQAEIPVLVSDLSEMKQIVNQYKIGEVIKNRNPIAVAKIIESMLENQLSYKTNLKIAANELCWKKEEKKLEELLKKLN